MPTFDKILRSFALRPKIDQHEIKPLMEISSHLDAWVAVGRGGNSLYSGGNRTDLASRSNSKTATTPSTRSARRPLFCRIFTCSPLAPLTLRQILLSASLEGGGGAGSLRYCCR